jgi:hypothetical protein
MNTIYYIYYLHKGDNVPFYIGKTNNPTTRKNKHKTKYGPFTKLEVLEETTTEFWRELEEFYIQLFRSWGFILDNGFKGGGGASKWTEDQKNNINRKTKLSKPKPEGFGEKISKNRNHKEAGEKASISNSQRGHYDKDSERNQKISQKLTGRKVDWTGDCILQYDLKENFIKEWPSIRQAGLEIKGTSGETIRKCLKGLQKTAYGFIWKYKI